MWLEGSKQRQQEGVVVREARRVQGIEGLVRNGKELGLSSKYYETIKRFYVKESQTTLGHSGQCR